MLGEMGGLRHSRRMSIHFLGTILRIPPRPDDGNFALAMSATKNARQPSIGILYWARFAGGVAFGLRPNLQIPSLLYPPLVSRRSISKI